MNRAFIPRNLRYLLAAFALSNLGLWSFTIAAPWVLYNRYHSAIGVAAGYVMTFAPQVLFTGVGGPLADHWPRGSLLMVSDGFSAIMLGLGSAITVDHGPPAVLYGLIFAVASAQAIYHPTFQAVLPETVNGDPALMASASNWMQGVQNVTMVAGPLWAGVGIGAMGVTGVFMVTGLLFLVAVVLNLRIRGLSEPVGSPSKPSSRSPAVTGVWQGWRFVRRHRGLWWGSLFFAAVNIGAGAIESLLLFFLRHHLGFRASMVGVMYAAQGIASIGAMLVTPRLSKRWRPLVLMVSASLVMVVGDLMIGLGQWPPIVIGGVMLVQGSIAVAATQWFTYRALVTPSDLLGRVVAATRTIAYLPLPLATLGAGLVANRIGADRVIVDAALVTLVAVIGVGGLLLRQDSLYAVSVSKRAD
ncbi:transporter, major facilitator family [Sulfobacillus acidophilus TPY]|uniref:Major facilitator superfamily MFS_1 n=1 Tax=Sulfobacillus acidophilus (strain ATCC 700253 / DSM 10332 / NAL) TaxID=679936 RepID=G8TYP4_SULAD|nr:transporter, major facilitator family [Sulfobacillus acidophilus TPY]AEW04009.1 major facilitator superfamily MFS_1 [Sulfobacillus acidophilus DSM 10332]